MVTCPTPRVVIEDERSKDLMFTLLTSRPGYGLFTDLLELHFGNDPRRLALLLEWLDYAGLEIRAKDGKPGS